MGNFNEEKALGNDYRCLDSFERDIMSFFGEIPNDFDHSIDTDWDDDDYESDHSSGTQDLSNRSKYWESQQIILQEILSHGRLTGKKVRREVNRAFGITREQECLCNYSKPINIDGCANCLRRSVVTQLCDNNLNAALCTSKWNSTRKVPGGAHEYIDVITRGPGRKKETRYLVELEFRSEFEIAKACSEYRNLINQLPKVFVGKPEHLHSIVRVMCNASKKSMKEKKIHIGPWRKKSFMQMKWLSSYRRYPYSDEQSTTYDQVSSKPMQISNIRCSSRLSATTAAVFSHLK